MSTLGGREQVVLDEMQAMFPGAELLDDYTPGPATIEVDLRPLQLICHPFRLEAELAACGELDYKCAICGARFVAASLFDAHRVSVPDRPGGRRCLNAQELRRGGLVKDRRREVWGRGSGGFSPSDLGDRSIAPPSWPSASSTGVLSSTEQLSLALPSLDVPELPPREEER